MGLKLELSLLKRTLESSGSSSSLPVSRGDTCPPCSHLLGMDIEREHFTSQPVVPKLRSWEPLWGPTDRAPGGDHGAQMTQGEEDWPRAQSAGFRSFLVP